MHRFFLPPDRCKGDHLELSESDAHHAASVLRVVPGEVVVILDGAGQRIRARVDSVHKRCVALTRISQDSTPASPYRVTLVQAVAKPKAMDWILQKSTELGVSAIQSIVTDHCVSRPNKMEAETKRAGWEVTVVEAAKQANAAWIPGVAAPISFKEFIAQGRTAELGLVASLREGAMPVEEAVHQFSAQHQRPPCSAALVIGPEGDFSTAELHQLVGSGYCPITLGPLILRCETAALAALTLVQHELRKAQAGRS